MKALLLDAENKTAHVGDVSSPTAASGEIVVSVKAIALNPVDPLYVAYPLASSGRVVGSDFAGTVVALGEGVQQCSQVKVGDRVAGFLQGACSVNERPGAFTEYLTIPWDLVWKVPNTLSNEEAAGVSLVSLTAAQGIWYRLGLNAPFPYNEEGALNEHPEWVWTRMESRTDPETVNFFIYGASTSVGLYVAQFIRLSAKASGRTVRLFGAASQARWAMLKSEPYGYEVLVDYRQADWPEQIRTLSDDIGMHYAHDCISEGDSVAKVSSVLAQNGRTAIVRSRAGGAWKADCLASEPIYGAVWEGLGEEVQYQGFTIKQSPMARAFAVEFYKWLSKAAGSAVRPVAIRLMPGGLEKVVDDGFALLGSGKMEERQKKREEEWMKPVSAEKVVYRIQKT